MTHRLIMTPAPHTDQTGTGRGCPGAGSRAACTRSGLRTALTAVLAAVVVGTLGCSPDERSTPGPATSTTAPPPLDGATTSPPTPAAGPVVLVTQGGHLDAFEPVPPFASQRVVTGSSPQSGGVDVRGQICPLPDGTGRLVVAVGTDAGSATDQPGPGGTGGPGVPPAATEAARWALFRLRGGAVGDLTAEPVGELTLDRGPGEGAFGCAFLSDGRLVTTDVGDPTGARADGRLVLWFPPYTGGAGRSCTLDAGIAAPRGLWVDDQDRIHVASGASPTAGVWRYSGPYPTGPDAAGGCGRTDPAGEAQADRTRRELFVPDGEHELTGPTGVAGGPAGTVFVAAATAGIVNEYDANGELLRTVLRPPPGWTPGPELPPTGRPLSIAVAPDGVIYYADVGAVATGTVLVGAPGTGSLRRITPPGPQGSTPETMAGALDHPTGVTLLLPGGGGAPSKV